MNLGIKSVLSGVALAALAGFSAGPNGDPNDPNNPSNVSGVQLTVKALQVTSTAPHMLSGAFELRAPNAGEQSVLSNGLGGACLVAQLPVQAKACTTNGQCDIVFGHNKPKWGGYCVHGSCWVKPSENYCLKRVGVGPHSTPAADATEVYAYAADHGGAPPAIKWRVLGCLNGVAVSQNSQAPAPCPGGPGEVMHDAGQPADVP